MRPMQPRPSVPFLDAVRKQILVFDGAMGSLLYERGVFVTQNFEQLNVTRPDVVRRIHQDYLEASAQVLQTNTFGANRVCLERHGLVGEARAFNLAGARLAREVAGAAAYVAGAIGPTQLVPGVSAEWDERVAEDAFAEQADALAEGGSDLIVLETFRHLDELALAVAGARLGAPRLPVLAMVTFEERGTVADGSPPEKVAERLRAMGVEAIGINHGDGPQLALAMAERMMVDDLPLCVQPNAGLPRTVDGRQLYMATPEYFDAFA
ncbi:MAG TPA: homocysteine S-methyltransferase family protein, partial [Polyangiaceae bacterium]|nr:homocysteine S-methyltransferase family protein [Polyangiaceae bacterium]